MVNEIIFAIPLHQNGSDSEFQTGRETSLAVVFIKPNNVMELDNAALPLQQGVSESIFIHVLSAGF